MKRTLLLLLAQICAAALFPQAHARAEEERVVFHVDTVDGVSGSDVDVSVLLGNCAGVDSVQFDLNYDADALKLVSVTFGELFSAYDYNDAEAGRVRVACANALGLKQAGTLLTLRFTATSETGSAVTVTNAIVTRVDTDYVQSPAFASAENGGVTIGSASLPAAKVTPWIPATATPTPSPEPTPTNTPTPSPTPTTALTAALVMAQRIPPVTYGVIGALVILLIVILSLAAAKRRKNNG